LAIALGSFLAMTGRRGLLVEEVAIVVILRARGRPEFLSSYHIVAQSSECDHAE
jgi:hypothetical protein